jgi:hypothetical protein
VIFGRCGRARRGGRDRLGRRFRHRPDKTVSPTGQSFYEARPVGCVAQDSTKPGNGVSTAVFEVDEGIGGPEFRPQLLSGDELAGCFEQDSQHLQRTALDR